MTHVYGWLAEQSAEDALHAERLLFIEERPFHRITRRLLGEDSLLRSKQLPTPPPEGAEETAKSDSDTQDEVFLRQKFREDVLVDFAALESSIMRIQLILSSNERERERYASEKAKILSTSQAVRDNTAQLREQLTEAQKVLELRKSYDVLAAKILDDRKLKSRDETRQDILTIEKDIAELEAESKDADEVWETRKAGFEELVGHGKAYLRAIKGIKDQPEEQDPMEDGEETKHDSIAGTPHHDGSSTPRVDAGSGTPVPEAIDGMLEGEDDGAHQPSKLRESSVLEPSQQHPTQDKSQDDAQMEDMPEDKAVDGIDRVTADDVTEDVVVEETMDET